MSNIPSVLLPQNVDRVWVDVESTGLGDDDVMLEIAAGLGDVYGNVGSKFQSLIWQPNWREKMDAADQIVKDMHSKSGLFEALDMLDGNVERRNLYTLGAVENELLTWFKHHGLQPSTLKMAGSSIHFDRRLVRKYMPKVEDFSHYRNVDVSSIKETCKGLNPELYAKLPIPQKLHRSLPDIEDTVIEYQFYIHEFMLWGDGE